MVIRAVTAVASVAVNRLGRQNPGPRQLKHVRKKAFVATTTSTPTSWGEVNQSARSYWARLGNDTRRQREADSTLMEGIRIAVGELSGSPTERRLDSRTRQAASSALNSRRTRVDLKASHDAFKSEDVM
ncbi:hypothetical protein HPB47_001601 [Ixodes persulcatus]|uniref:Uncharacterized protein n=1 Tax=Ixodes persulcatus TaxID=34615 RepID=A0AC60PNK3_IXOPE|nr:hypothetical protein HPB47_001601 [Ixodes persulcatus]